MKYQRYKVGDRVIIEKSNIEGVESYAGRSGVITSLIESDIPTNDYPYRVDAKGTGCGVWCTVRGYENKPTVEVDKFKVGDRVIIEESNIEGMAGVNLRGKNVVGTISSINPLKGSDHPYWVTTDKYPIGLYCKVKCLAPNNDDKVVITHDGKTTTAKLYKGEKEVKTATAKCAPDDTFDFMVGAKLAMERLSEPVKPKCTYYNGKVVCVESCNDDFTVGKVYEIENGKFTDNDGRTRPMTNNRVTTLNDLTNDYFKDWAYTFIPFVE